MRNLNTLFIKAKNNIKNNKEQLYLAFISYKDNMYNTTCCYIKNGKETKRETTNHKTKEEAHQYIEHMVDKYPYEVDTIVLEDLSLEEE